MSLSNLESQLASINSSSGLPSSKKHHESVGRGLHHSVKHGHAILNSNAKHKPSVLHSNSRSAAVADIPFTTLHENSVISLQYLLKESSNLFDIKTNKLPWGTLFGPKSINFERGLNTPETNKKIDAQIKDAVFILSSSWGDANVSTNGPSLSSIPLGANISSSVLHIMEYLVQKYYIHVHNSETLLVSFLPHHETFIFKRILQLVDLSQFPHWSFLRPYSATEGVRGVPRTLIAKWAASTADNGGGIVLINVLCDIARRAAKVHSQENTRCSPTSKRSVMEIRRGTSLIISFAAATLAESLQIQNSTCGTIVEPTVRSLLPFIFEAVEPHRSWKKKANLEESATLSLGAICAEWRSFGYVLISMLMKNCELSTDVCEILATGIIKGSMEVERMLRRQEQFGNIPSGKGNSTVPSLKAMESVSDSLLALMSILSSCDLEMGCTGKNSALSQSLLHHVLTPNGRMDCSFGSSNGTLGCGLSLSTFHMLVNFDILPTALGYLFENRHVDIRPLLTSLIILCVSAVSDGEKRNCELIMKLAIRLIEESTLRSAWLEKDYSLSTSTSVFFVKAFAHCCCSSNVTNSVKRFAKLLRCVRAIDPIGCDAGVGYVVTSVSSAVDAVPATVENMKMLLKLSGHLQGETCAFKNIAADDARLALGFGNNDSLRGVKITAFDHILPSRVALEHPMEDIRIGAIQRLMQEVNVMSRKERDDVAYSLFRRYITDDTASVAAAAANAVISLLESGVLSKDFLCQPSVMEDSVVGIKKWSVARQFFRHNNVMQISYQNKKKKDKNELSEGNLPRKLSVSENEVSSVISSIRVSGLFAKRMMEELSRNYQFDSLTYKEWSNTVPESLFFLVQELVLHVGIGIVTNHDGKNVSNGITETALNSLLAAFGEDVKDNGNGMGMQTIWNNSVFLGIVSRCIRDISRTPSNPCIERKTFEEEGIARETFMQIFLTTSAMDHNNDLHDKSVSIQWLAALALLTDFCKSTLLTDSFLEDACQIRKCLEKYASYCVEEGGMEMTIQFIIDLSSISSPVAFEHISLPIIKVIQKAFEGDKLSGKFLLILLETCSRPSIDTMVLERTLNQSLLAIEPHPNKEIVQCVLITALALLVHSELNVREGALEIFNKLESAISNEGSLEVIEDLCSLVCKRSSSFRASLLLDGANALPRLLQRAIQGSDNASELCDILLESCVVSVTTMQHLKLPNPIGFGSCKSAALVISAMESAGESSFPLHKRWDITGKAFFDLFLQHRETLVPSTVQELVECVVVMLKGVTVVCNATKKHVMITTGPSGLGRRHRSYSFGKSDGLSYIEPYPISMVNSIKDCLCSSSLGKEGQLALELCESVNRLVLGRSSWLNGIFPQLDTDTRKFIAISLLKLRTQSSIESAGIAFSGLALDSSELCNILSSINHQTSCHDSGNFFALSLIADFVRGRANILANDSNLLDLSSCIFKQVSQLSLDGNDGSEYTRSCLLHALCSLHDQNKISDFNVICPNKPQRNQKYPKQIGEHARHIVSLLGAGDDGITPLQSSKSRIICLTLLTNLCSTFPATVVHCLLPTIAHVMSSVSSSTPIPSNIQLAWKTKAAEETLKVIIPAYCKHAPVAGLTLLNLLSAFLGNCDLGEKADYNTHVQLMCRLIDSLTSSLKVDDSGVAIASVVAYFIAQMSSSCVDLAPLSTANTSSNGNILAFISKLLTNVHVFHQIVVARQILQYTMNMIALLHNRSPLGQSSDKQHDGFLIVSSRDLSHLATRGNVCGKNNNNLSFSKTEKTSLMWLTRTLLEIVRSNILSASVVKQAIRSCDDKQAEICLYIWQTLVAVQSNSSQLQYEEESAMKTQNVTYQAFSDAIEFETSASIALIQRLLPVPHFLASVSSIINETDTDHDLQKKAVSLLAERSAEIDATSAEGALFLDIIPGLVNLISKKPAKNNEYQGRRLALLQEASCRALGQLGRSLGLVDDKKIIQRRSTLFLPALRTMTHFLHSVSHSPGDILSSTFEHIQALSSLTMCLSSLVTLLKARCLPELPKLVKSLISLLSLVNLHAQSTIDMKTDRNQGVKLLQLSLLRTLVAVVETLPQFMVSYIKPLLTPSGLLCITLRQHGTNDKLAVKMMTERLDNTLANLTPSRQLIPILCTSINECFNEKIKGTENHNEGMAIFPILKAAIGNSSRPDLGPVAGKIVNALIQTYGYDCDAQTNFKLLETANATLVALVMKLSEVQLRRLYAKFRQWSVIPEMSTGKVSALRRHSFYSLSAAMSKELRSLFLPCVSTIIGDITKELENAALCMGATSKETERNKRRKLNGSIVEYDYHETRPLQPLLLLLETALKADAHEGGTWIRSDDNDRYRMLVGPMGKLLQLPRESITILDFDKQSKNASSYERLVQGVGTKEYGNVISCITSLATAAGNEQLWKPLNHLLLEACRNERSEVRKSGVKALLSIIESLGEEYMVLLPECLPVLSELLEDAEDEEVIVLAKECIRQGEELLGESLEDSLK